LASKLFNFCGKRKGDGIPLLVYGRDGKKRVKDWWKRWKAKLPARPGSVANEGFPFMVNLFMVNHLQVKKIMDTFPSM